MLSGFRFDIRPVDAEFIHIHIKLIDKTIGKLFRAAFLFLRPDNDFIINVGKITNICNFIVPVPQIANNHVKGECRPCMADMTMIPHT